MAALRAQNDRPHEIAHIRSIRLLRSFDLERNRPIQAIGAGRTKERFARLRSLAQTNMSLARLVEADADARAIATELGISLIDPTVSYGVWAATGGRKLDVRHVDDGAVRVSGPQPWCGGATIVSRALVVVDRDNTIDLIDVETKGCRIDTSPWKAAAFSDLGTATVHFEDTHGHLLTAPIGDYSNRPGFWHGAIGVAACWAGGLQSLMDHYLGHWARVDDHSSAQLGAAVSELEQTTAILEWAADEIDRDPADIVHARNRAEWVRYCIERSCTRAIDHLEIGAGPAPLVETQTIIEKTQELRIVLRQTHGLRDVENLGRTTLQRQTV